MRLRTSVIAASTGALLALSAGAVSAASFSFEQGDSSLSAGENVLLNTTLTPTDTSATQDFTAESDLRLSRFAVTGNGFSGGRDLIDVSFGYTQAGSTTSKFFTFTPEELAELDINDPVGARDSLPGFNVGTGDMFSVFANYGGGLDSVDVDVAFSSTAVETPPNPIPVPAAGGLLLGALGLGGMIARKKKADA